MVMQREYLIEKLGRGNAKSRLKALKKLKKLEDSGAVPCPENKGYAGIKIHTAYSYSPYPPTLAVYMAYRSGVDEVGIFDHDTLGGATEFERAAKLLGLDSTVGLAHKVKFDEQRYAQRRINSLYQDGIFYLSVMGIPPQFRKALDAELARSRACRETRARIMTENLDKRIKRYGLRLNYERDVRALSNAKHGGAVTERHILRAFAKKLTDKFKTGEQIIEFLETSMKLTLSDNQKTFLADKRNTLYEFDLVDIIKSKIKFFYSPAEGEVDDARTFVECAHGFGGMVFYTYVGDYTSIRGGERIENKFEDDYLTELIDDLKAIGFDGVEFVPERLEPQQRATLEKLAAEREMLVLPALEINSPRQKFGDAELLKPDNSELLDNCRVVLGHEKSASFSIDDGWCSQKTADKKLSFAEKRRLYREIGKMTLR